MKTICLSILSLVLIACLFFVSACVKGTANNPGGGINAKAIANGSIISLTSLRDSFQALAISNPGKYQNDIDALNKILVIATPINDELQSTGKTTQQQIEDFARIGTNIAGTVGLSPDIVIAINLGIGIFRSIEPLIFPSTSSGPVAASDPSDGPAQRLGRLQALDSTYRRAAKR